MDKTLQFGKYQLLKRVAVGGMAELFLGKITGDQGFEKLVAIKCILPHFCSQPEVVQAFIDEAKVAAFLQHENIVQIYDFGCFGNRYFMAMEYLFGVDLRRLTHRIAERGEPLELGHALEIVTRVCAGLDHAHRLTDYRGRPLGVVHRDVSPQNVMVCYSGLVKILDFGVAKAAGRSAATQSGVIKGKTAYMSPEQAGGRPVDRRSDIFSAGVLLYELVTGRRMFDGEPLEVLERVRTADYTPADAVRPGLPKAVCGILDRALAPDPEDRYGECRDMRADLEACAAELASSSDTRQLGRLVRGLFQEEMKNEDRTLKESMPHERRPVPSSAAAEGLEMDDAAEATATLTAGAGWASGERRRRFLLLAGALAFVFLIGLGLFQLRPRSPAVPPDVRSPESFAARESQAPGAGSGAPEAAPDADARNAIVAEILREAEPLGESDPEQAVRILSQGLEIAPADTRLLFQLGLAFMRMRQYHDAITAFTRAVEVDEGLYDARFNLAFAYSESGDFEAAERSYLQVVESAPPYLDEVLFNLAIVQERLGKREDAIRQLDLAVRFNPHNVNAIDYLYRLQGRKGNAE